MSKVAAQSPTKFELQRYARDELLISLTSLLGTGDETRPQKLLFIDAACEYLQADVDLDEHRRVSESFWERYYHREELLTCIYMVQGEHSVSSHALDVIVREFGNFLASEGAPSHAL